MRTCYTLKKKEVLFLSFPASPQGLALLAQSKRVASRVCKAASLQSSPTPAPRQLPASLWNLRALTPNTPPKLPLRQLPASLWNLRALAPNTPPKLPLPPTLASRAPLACRGRRRPRRWRVEPRWPAGEDDGCACGTSARWPRSLPPSLGLDPPPKRRTKRWGGGDGWAPDKALPLPGRLPLRGVFSLRKALRLAKAIFVGCRPPSPRSAYRISSHTARHLLAADRGATKEMRRPLSRGDMPPTIYCIILGNIFSYNIGING